MDVSTDLAPSDYATVERIARDLVATIDGALHAAVSVVIDDTPLMAVTTDSHLDVEIDDGPAASVAMHGRIHRVPSVLNNDGEFPNYVAECKRVGISSVAAFPIKCGRTTIGVLTVTSADHHGFGPYDLRAGRSAADELAPLLSSVATTGELS